MKLLKNGGTDRVVDELRRSLAPQRTLDIATPAFSLFAFADPVPQSTLSVGNAGSGPTRVITDDVAKSNLTAILQQHGLENVCSL